MKACAICKKKTPSVQFRRIAGLLLCFNCWKREAWKSRAQNNLQTPSLFSCHII